MNNEEKELLQLLSTPHLRVKNTSGTLTKCLCRIAVEHFVTEKLCWSVPKRKEKPPAKSFCSTGISCTDFRMRRKLKRDGVGLPCRMHHAVFHSSLPYCFLRDQKRKGYLLAFHSPLKNFLGWAWLLPGFILNIDVYQYIVYMMGKIIAKSVLEDLWWG